MYVLIEFTPSVFIILYPKLINEQSLKFEQFLKFEQSLKPEQSLK